jgi:hypothetical protein
MTDETVYSVVSTVEPPASQMANSIPGYIEIAMSGYLWIPMLPPSPADGFEDQHET